MERNYIFKTYKFTFIFHEKGTEHFHKNAFFRSHYWRCSANICVLQNICSQKYKLFRWSISLKNTCDWVQTLINCTKYWIPSHKFFMIVLVKVLTAILQNTFQCLLLFSFQCDSSVDVSFGPKKIQRSIQNHLNRYWWAQIWMYICLLT